MKAFCEGFGEEARSRRRGAEPREALDALRARELVASGDLRRLGGIVDALQAEKEDEGAGGEVSGPGAFGRLGGGCRQSTREPLVLFEESCHYHWISKH